MFDLTLTFDNGPDLDVTPEVLNILARRGIKSTFFVIGEKLARAESRMLAGRAHAEGHWIGNHSWTHSIPLGERREHNIAVREIGRTQKAIGNLAHAHRYFRPFGGGGNLDRRLLNAAVVKFLEMGKYSCVLWNSIPHDWDDPLGWVDRALKQCGAQPWTVMVLHDLPTGAMRHLDRFLDRVDEAGGRLRQDFPADCMPIVDGIVVRPIEDYVALGDAAKE